MMTSLEKSVQALKSDLSTANGPSYARLCAAEQRARERRHLGLPDPLPYTRSRAQALWQFASRVLGNITQALYRTISA